MASPSPSLRLFAVAAAVLLLAVPASGCMSVVDPKRLVAGDPWAADMTEVTALADKGYTGKGVKVAVIDTGIDLNHPQFRGVSVQWADLVNGRAQAYDDNGHGTHVAGIIKAQGDWQTLLSGFAVQGVAPDVQLIVIKAIAGDGRGDESKVAAGVRTAVANGAHVIVLSLGGGTLPVLGTETERAVRDAVSKGVFVVAAAGNAKDNEKECGVTSPASVRDVIAVGAVDRAKRLADFSCRGQDNDGSLVPGSGRSDPHKKPEVVAPGVEILSAWTDGKYVQASGTSQAAPIVGGIIALVLEAQPDLKRQDRDTVNRVKEALMTSSAKIGPLAGKSPSTHDDGYGYGLVQGERLLKALR